MDSKIVNSVKDSNNGTEFTKLLSSFVSDFIETYNTAQNNFFPNGMPRRMQLFSLIMQLFLRGGKRWTDTVEAFLNDNEVKNVFKYDGATDIDAVVFGSQTCIVDNSGSGGTQQPISIITNIFLCAVDLSVLDTGVINKDNITSNIPRAFERFKSFARGESTKEEYLVGFAGFETDGDISIGFGDLNAFSLNDLQSNYFFGNRQKIGFVIKKIFSRRKLFVGTPDEMRHFFDTNKSLEIDNGFIPETNSLIRNVRLALALSLSNEGGLFSSFVEGDYLITATGNMNSFMWFERNNPKKNTTIKLTSIYANKISMKYLSLVSSNLESINIALSRLLSATCSRDNLDDALIDAVMCWENIIGSGSEVSFRTCASMAKLLSSDKGERSRIFGELKKIYDSRSKLVHGDNSYKTNSETVNSAILYAIKLINAMLLNETLLDTESKNRGRLILLEG